MRTVLVVVLVLILLLLEYSLLMSQGRANTPLSTLSFVSTSPSQTSRTTFPLSYRVQGSPTITVAFINRVLAFYHSPAVSTEQALYTEGRQYGIDPVYALAFFLHESRFGTTGVARVTRSLGNIRCSVGYTCIDGYRAYSHWEDSYLDWYQLILSGYVQGAVTIPLVGHTCATVNQIIPVYAPSSDGNDVMGYIRAVEQAVETWRNGKVEVMA